MDDSERMPAARELGELHRELEHQRRLVRMYRGIAHRLEERHEVRARTLRTPWGQTFIDFVHELEKRLLAGHEEYGDQSWRRSDAELAAEADEELLDNVGWTFLRWGRRRLEGDGGGEADD